MTLQLNDDDFTTLEHFGRRERFTGSPPDVLTRLRPLRPEIARELLPRSRALCHAPLATGVRMTAAGQHDVVRRGLSKLPVQPGTSILVQWDATNALVTDWSVFVQYWEAFCHPSTDDVTICPVTGMWVLCYDREEHFTFMSQRAAG